MPDTFSNSESSAARLSAGDCAAVDAVMEGDETGEVDGARVKRVEGWLEVIGADRVPTPAAGGESLVQKTLAAVANDRMRIAVKGQAGGAASPAESPAAAESRWRRKVAEFAAMGIAAALLLAVSLEGISQAHKSQARVACQGNLQAAGVAFGHYATDYRGALPALAMPGNGSWLHGNGEGAQNNAANLIPLVNAQLLTATAFYCAGAGLPEGPVVVKANALPTISYSYRNLYGADRPTWDGGHETIVLTDRNPVFAEDEHGGKRDAERQNSPNHGGYGTYALRADGAATWEMSPRIGPGNDNIWTIGSGKDQLLVYSGVEAPKTAADVFMCP